MVHQFAPLRARMARVLAAAVVWMATGVVALAQQGTASLQGRAVDASGAALPGVVLVLRSQDTGLYRETTSGTDGTFSFPAMTPGVYVLDAQLAGFENYREPNLRLEIGKTTTVDVALAVGG